MKHFGIFFLGFILAALLSACGEQEESAVAVEESATMIGVAQAVRETVIYSTETVGVLESVNSPRIAAEVAGKIIDIFVDSGQVVSPGEVLLKVDPSNLLLQEKAARAELEQLSVQIENEKVRLRRLQELGEKDYVSKSGLDDAEAKLASYQAQSEAARARLSLVQDQLSRTEIKSPFTARIDQRLVSVGDYLRPGTAVFTLAETRYLQARLPVPEVAGARLSVGQPVEMVIATDPDNVVHSRIRELQPVVTAGARSLILLADVTASEKRYPGATVRAKIVVGENPEAVQVPTRSIVRRPAGDVVYLVFGNRVEEQKVTRGVSQDGMTEILDGLEGEEMVVTDGAGFLTDGARVRVAR